MNIMDQKLTFISKEKLFEMIENKEKFRLIEVLSEESYNKGHIPTAISIPAGVLEEKAPELLPDKEETVVTYCSSFTCLASSTSARFLMALGYKHVLDYKGGKKDWEKAELPLITD